MSKLKKNRAADEAVHVNPPADETEKKFQEPPFFVTESASGVSQPPLETPLAEAPMIEPTGSSEAERDMLCAILESIAERCDVPLEEICDAVHGRVFEKEGERLGRHHVTHVEKRHLSRLRSKVGSWPSYDGKAISFGS